MQHLTYTVYRSTYPILLIVVALYSAQELQHTPPATSDLAAGAGESRRVSNHLFAKVQGKLANSSPSPIVISLLYCLSVHLLSVYLSYYYHYSLFRPSQHTSLSFQNQYPNHSAQAHSEVPWRVQTQGEMEDIEKKEEEEEEEEEEKEKEKEEKSS